jgi:hypothetical protein
LNSRSDASETASAYITLDGAGIKVHSTTSLSDYVHISPNNIVLYGNGGGTLSLDSDGIKIKDKNTKTRY